jgi:hypothetical protein
VKEAPAGDGWLHETKFDGYRIGCRIDGKSVALLSRNGKDWTARFPEIAEAARRLPVRRALLDGEVALVLPDGRTSFQALQNSFGDGSRERLFYYVFDLAMTRFDPSRYTTSIPKAGRERKILVDYLWNNRTNTSVAAYSTRARANAAVSTPLAWDELSDDVRSDHYTVKSLPGRLRRLRRDPWARCFRLAQRIEGSTAACSPQRLSQR